MHPYREPSPRRTEQPRRVGRLRMIGEGDRVRVVRVRNPLDVASAVRLGCVGIVDMVSGAVALVVFVDSGSAFFFADEIARVEGFFCRPQTPLG